MARPANTYRAFRRNNARLMVLVMRANGEDVSFRETLASQPRFAGERTPKVKDRPYRANPAHRPHQGKLECARRIKQRESANA